MTNRCNPSIFKHQPQPTAVPPQPPVAPKVNLWERYVDLLYKGHNMDSMTCNRYCKWQWDIRDPDTFNLTRRAFIKSCRTDCASFKAQINAFKNL